MPSKRTHAVESDPKKQIFGPWLLSKPKSFFYFCSFCLFGFGFGLSDKSSCFLLLFSDTFSAFLWVRGDFVAFIC